MTTPCFSTTAADEATDRTLRNGEAAALVEMVRQGSDARETGATSADDPVRVDEQVHVDGNAPTDADALLPVSRILYHGVAAFAVTLVALVVVSTVLHIKSAQADEQVLQHSEGSGRPDTSLAVPEQQAHAQMPAAQQRDGHPDAQSDSRNGDLAAFERGADPAAADPVRRELDRVIADRKAQARESEITETNDAATETSDGRIVDARGNALVDQQEATKREQARLEEEKRKAEQALAEKRRRDAMTSRGTTLPPMPMPTGDSTAVGNGATPMAKGSYSVGARWGAVGSWSRYHTGIDLRAPVGNPVHAAADGVVMPANGGGWAGTHVIIRHADGSATLYAHMSGTTVNPGQTVKAGQVIGAVGMTGRTFGPHLHFEHYPQASGTGNPYTTDDPYRWMQSLGVPL